MNKIIERLLMFAVGLPLVICVILVFPQKNHLAVNTIVIILSALGALEFCRMISRGKSSLSIIEVLLLGALPAIGTTLTVSFGLQSFWPTLLFLIGAAWLLVSCVFLKEDAFPQAVEKIASGFSIMVYPGFFMMWIIRMSLLSN
jgi:phosphatidate cytidylyltransferase